MGEDRCASIHNFQAGKSTASVEGNMSRNRAVGSVGIELNHATDVYVCLSSVLPEIN